MPLHTIHWGLVLFTKKALCKATNIIHSISSLPGLIPARSVAKSWHYKCVIAPEGIFIFCQWKMVPMSRKIILLNWQLIYLSILIFKFFYQTHISHLNRDGRKIIFCHSFLHHLCDFFTFWLLS